MRPTAAVAAKDVWLGVLATVVVVALSVGTALAMGWRLDGGFRGGPAAGQAGATASRSATPPTTSATSAPSGTAAPVRSTSAPPSGSTAGATASGATSARPAMPTLTWSDGATIMVLGDGTADSDRTWISVWARALGATHRVTLASWNADSQRWVPTIRYGQAGSVVTIRDGSAPGVNLRTTLRGSVALTDPATEPTPDLILGCVGRAETEESIAASLDALVATAATYSPTPPVVLVAAPTAPTSVLESVRVRSLQWADERGIPVIDVRADAEGRGTDLLTSDPAEIGDPGATFWGRAIRDRLGS